MTCLITGATGNIGSLVVDRLLDRGEYPRVFVRNADKARARYGDRADIAVGDLADTESLAAALGGIDELFLVSTGRGLATLDETAAKTALACGVQKLVKLSSMDAQENVGSGIFHARGERAIRASGINFVFVRPAGFCRQRLNTDPLSPVEN